MIRESIKLLPAVLLLILCSHSLKAENRIAIVGDPHIMDVVNYPGLTKSLADEVTSTRLFNENIYAFRAVLEDIASKGIDLVIITGDMTDDGQVLNQECARNILNEYAGRYGMRFFLTPGNHDPKEPFGRSIGYSTLLRSDGSTYAAVSDSSLYRPGVDVIPGLRSVGHKEQMECYSDFGYYPREDYLYWSSPLAEEYSPGPENREFVYAGGIRDIDMSYAVEPVEGLWILSIDSGVYLPHPGNKGFTNSSPGYSLTLNHKPYLLPWIKTVVKEAEVKGKALIAFSHFPANDFLGGAAELITDNWKDGALGVSRVPSRAVTDSLTATGLKYHFAGHLHIYDVSTNIFGGDSLTNIQVPVAVAGVPAYLEVAVSDDGGISVEAVTIRDVPGFDSLFQSYRNEMKHSLSEGKKPIWNPSILDSRNYAELCDCQFRDLVRLRFCKSELPEELSGPFLKNTGEEIYTSLGGTDALPGMEGWTGYDIILDLYRFHYSGELARELISRERVEQYELLFSAADKCQDDTRFVNQVRLLGELFTVLAGFDY